MEHCLDLRPQATSTTRVHFCLFRLLIAIFLAHSQAHVYGEVEHIVQQVVLVANERDFKTGDNERGGVWAVVRGRSWCWISGDKRK